MIKHLELTDPNSCLNKVKDDERVFVLVQRDISAPGTIRWWAAERIKLGKNRPGDGQITEALNLALEIERELYPWDVDSEEFRTKNNRRSELIHRKHRGGLLIDEMAELERLQLAIGAVINRAYPLGDQEIDAKLDALQRRLEQRYGPHS